MDSDEKLDEIYNLIDKSHDCVDMIDKSLAMLLAVNMMDEYKTTLKNYKERAYAHIFFNCDENKSSQSMNITYNNQAYGDSAAGRKSLLNKVMKERKESKIYIEENKLEIVRSAILKGYPEDANPYIKYGCIVTICVDS